MSSLWIWLSLPSPTLPFTFPLFIPALYLSQYTFVFAFTSTFPFSISTVYNMLHTPRCMLHGLLKSSSTLLYKISAWVCKITLGHYAFINYDCARRKMKNHCSVIWLSLQTALAQVTGFTLGTEGDGSLHCAILTLPCWCWCLVFNLNARSTD